MATIRSQLHRNSCGLIKDPTSCEGEDWTGTRLKFSLATSTSFCYLLDKFFSSLIEGIHQIMAKTNESFIADIYFTYKFSRRHLSEHQYKTIHRKTLIPGINSYRAKACSYTSHSDTIGPAASPVESCLSLGTRPYKIGFLYSASYLHWLSRWQVPSFLLFWASSWAVHSIPLPEVGSGLTGQAACSYRLFLIDVVLHSLTEL